MSSIGSPLRDRRLQAFLFALSCGLLSWPLLSIVDSPDNGAPMYAYLFLCWMAIIGILYAIGRSCAKETRR